MKESSVFLAFAPSRSCAGGLLSVRRVQRAFCVLLIWALPLQVTYRGFHPPYAEAASWPDVESRLLGAEQSRHTVCPAAKRVPRPGRPACQLLVSCSGTLRFLVRCCALVSCLLLWKAVCLGLSFMRLLSEQRLFPLKPNPASHRWKSPRHRVQFVEGKPSLDVLLSCIDFFKMDRMNLLRCEVAPWQ